MAEKILNTRILLKYDTLANWEASTGILRAGEVAIATVPEGSTGKEVGSVATPQVLVKVGDGKSTFKQLPYITAKAGDVYAWAKQAHPVYISGVNEETGAPIYKNLSDEILAILGDVANLKTFQNGNPQVIANAIKEAKDYTDAEIKKLTHVTVEEDEGKTGNVVTNVTQANGIVTVTKGTLAVGDLEGGQGVLTDISNIKTDIAGVKTTATENLAEAKGYADQQVNALANDAVKKNTDAIAAINHGTTGILATANAYTDTEVGNAKTAAATDAQNKANKALEDAQKYVDDAISAITGGETGSLKALEKRVTANEAAIGTMPPAGEDGVAPTLVGMIEAAKQEAADAVDAEELRATNAETALDARLDAVETFFHFSSEEEKNVAYDTLKEIQDYIEGDASAAAQLTAKVNQNTAALGAVEFENGVPKKTLTAMIEEAAQAASQAIANEKLLAEGKEAENAAAAAEADRKAVAAQGEIDALEKVVGTPTEGKTIVEMIAAAQTAATYDDTEVRGLINTNATNIGNEVTRATGAEKAINDKIGAEALTGGYTTLIAAINAAAAASTSSCVASTYAFTFSASASAAVSSFQLSAV